MYFDVLNQLDETSRQRAAESQLLAKAAEAIAMFEWLIGEILEQTNGARVKASCGMRINQARELVRRFPSLVIVFNGKPIRPEKGHPARCEWDPENDGPATTTGGCQNPATVSVGDGAWQLCEGCAALPRFKSLVFVSLKEKKARTLTIVIAGREFETQSVLLAGNGDPIESVRLERARQADGAVLWAIRRRGFCLSTTGAWVLEPIPSSRDDEFLRSHRWPTPESAVLAFEEVETDFRCQDGHQWESGDGWGVVIGVSKCRRCGKTSDSQDFPHTTLSSQPLSEEDA